MEELKNDFEKILIKYNFYEKIEPKLSWCDSVQFETIKEIICNKKKNSLKIFINSYGIDNIINKIANNVPNINNNDIEIFKLKLNEIILI